MVNTSYNFYFANILFCDYYCVYKTIFYFAIHKIQDKGLKHIFYIKVLIVRILCGTSRLFILLIDQLPYLSYYIIGNYLMDIITLTINN